MTDLEEDSRANYNPSEFTFRFAFFVLLFAFTVEGLEEKLTGSSGRIFPVYLYVFWGVWAVCFLPDLFRLRPKNRELSVSGTMSDLYKTIGKELEKTRE